MTQKSVNAPSPLQSIVAGAAAGGIESLTTYPTEYVKTRKQLLGASSPSPLRLLITAVRDHGVGVLYTGAGAFCVSNASKSGIRFLTFDVIRNKLPRDQKTGKPTSSSNMLAGVAAGVAESITVVTPGESIKTKIVEDRAGSRTFKSTGDAMRWMASNQGIPGFYRGVVPVTMKQASNALVRFTSYHAIFDLIEPRLKDAGKGSLAVSIAGASAGVVTVYATMPFDTIKTKMQSVSTGIGKQGTLHILTSIIRESGVAGLWKGTTPRLVRLSCDGQIPACTNCAKAGQVCLDVDSQNSNIVIPRNFVGAARARIQWLENIIRERAPDVDLQSGPQIEQAPDIGSRSVDEGGNEEGDTSTTPAATIPSPALQTISRKRSAEASEQPDHDGSFPERAHSVAVNLGMLSLNSDSPQKHYLGSSSGLLFANLIGASPSSTGSTPQGMGDNVNAGDLEWQDSAVSAGHNKAYHQAMHAFLKSELPTKQEALILAHTYIRWVHPDFPVLEPSSLFSAIDAIYSCVFESGQVDGSTHGWPSTMPPFRWNGRRVTPGVPEDHGATLPVIAFIIFMVFNIAAIVKVRTRVYEFPPQRFYSAAVHFSKDAFSQISLPTIQAMVMLINHSMLMPAEINLWTLVHLASAHCVELGIHREHHSERPEDFAMKQIRRFTFFTIYSLDRSISSIQGRPLGFRDETFDIGLPESPPPEDDDMNGAIPHSFMAAVTRYASYTYKLDRIVSDIKLHLYHLPGDSSWFPWPENPVEHQQRIKQTLDTWWQEAYQDEFDFPSLDNRQREVWRLKLRIKYHTATVLLFQPSQVVRNPSAQALQLCFDSSSRILEGYERLHDLHSLHHGWRAVQNIFAAGATLIYSFWTSLQVRKKASTASMSKNLRTCSSLLTIGGEWWPSAKSGQRSFGPVADLTMRKLYMDDSPFKAPRLSQHSTAAGHFTRRVEGPETEDECITVLRDSQALEGINQLPLEEPDGAWQGVTVASGHDQDMWHGIEIGRPDFVPEIEMFLADFDRSEFTWSFPLDSNKDLDPFGTHPNTGF
ncbi:Fungal-trans domain-containing protein [Fusarium sp. Ph1]|nr:Fungal-trans domain-containing protein [Fusarium sp. Ph1]